MEQLINGNVLELNEPDVFPVDPFGLKMPSSTVIRLPYSRSAKLITELKMTELMNKPGFSAFYTDVYAYIIFYRDSLKKDELHRVLFHEFGHIACGHVTEDLKRHMSREENTEAETLALHLRAPAEKLSKLGVHTPEDISKLTGITLQEAGNVAKDIKALSGGDKEKHAGKGVEWLRGLLSL